MFGKLPLDAEILTEIAAFDRFSGQWSAGTGLTEQRKTALRQAARVQSVASSFRLCGIRVTDGEVAAVLRGETSLPQRDLVEIRGYAAACEHPLTSGAGLFGAGELARFHALMMGETGTDPSPWRSEPLHREEFDAGGRATGRVFCTLPPRLIEEKTEALLTWLEIEWRRRENHPALVVGAFVLGLLAISPFRRGNGRLWRLLAWRMLERVGYGFMPYASFERLIEVERDQYHRAFDDSYGRIWTGEADLRPWIGFFVGLLGQHRQRAESRRDLELATWGYSPLQQAIVESVREHGDVGAGLLLRATGANRNTLKDNLRRLVDRGVLERWGERRGTRYRLASGALASVVETDRG